MKNKACALVIFLCAVNFLSACGKKQDLPSIASSVSFPSSLVSLSATQFLMLNSAANQDYKEGSIQLYAADAQGNTALQNSLPVPYHGSELAVSPTGNLVAMSFDMSVSPTQLLFYDYSTPTSPHQISTLTLSLPTAGGKQAVKRLGFFTPTSPAAGNYYYLYGMILSYPQDDGSASGIPSRVFVVRIAKDFSAANVMFTLSYGVNDPTSLAQKSDSIVPYNYTFGTSAPTYDESHDLLIAFPTGSIGGYNGSTYAYPPNPDALAYFSGQPNANTINCGVEANCTQPDMRTNSMFVVDFKAILNAEPLNNSTYFTPLAWNYNGIPYGAITNGTTVRFPSDPSNGDSTSFGFQNGFWSSYWLNTPNLGSGSSQCYLASGATTAANEYNLAAVGGNGLLVAKSGANGPNDNGLGNEIFQITGLDVLRTSIDTIKTQRGNISLAGENDFKLISKVQILDPFNSYYTAIQAVSPWLNGVSSSQGVLPVVPYLYSRTTNVASFYAGSSGVGNFGVLNFGANSCLPYWERNSAAGFSSFGMDSAWLTSTPVRINAGDNATFSNAVADPTQPAVYSFPYGAGAQVCTDVSPAGGTPFVYCANFLKGDLTRFAVSSSGSVFAQF